MMHVGNAIDDVVDQVDALEAAQNSAKQESTRSCAERSKSWPAKTIPASTNTFLLH